MITIIQQPDPTRILNPFNDLPFVVESDNSDEDGFSFICDVRVNGVTVSRQTKAIIGGLDRTFFDVKSIVESSLSVSFDTSNDLLKNESACIVVSCLFGERYGGVDYIDPGVESDEFNILNGSLTFNESMTLLYGNIDMSTSGVLTPGFLTSRTGDRRSIDDTDYMSFFYGKDTYEPEEIVFKKYEPTGSLLATNNITIGTLDYNSVYTFGAGPKNMRQLFGDSYFTGVSYYTIQIDTKSSIFRYDIIDRCTEHDLVDVLFLNKFGVFDSFTFDLKTQDSSDIKRSKANVKRGYFDLVSGEYEYGALRATSRPYDTVVTDKITLNSNWIDDEKATHLKELFSSPLVYVLRNGVIEPYDVDDQPYVKKRLINDWLFNYTITLTAQQSSNRQKI